MAEIRIERLSKRFADGTEPLSNANFTVHDGELFVLVGPSGCGKSTLLNMIVGLESVSEGEIRVDGEPVNHLDPKDRNMAMVFQSYAIYPHMTVRENIAFPLKITKVPKNEVEHRVSRVATILELEKLLDRKPASLSGGQRQRVAMGRAIVREPCAFLLDEPLSNLDARLRVQMRNEIARLQKRLRATMIYVTHDQTEAMTLGNRIAVLNRGQVQQIGTPRALYENPANLFVASFLGSPSMNFLPARIEDNRVSMPMVQFAIPAGTEEKIRFDSGFVCAGIRPEHILHADSPAADRNFGPVFEVTAELVEWLGADTVMYFQVSCPSLHLEKNLRVEYAGRIGTHNEISVAARIDPVFSIREGDRVPLWLDARKMQWFDCATGENLKY